MILHFPCIYIIILSHDDLVTTKALLIHAKRKMEMKKGSESKTWRGKLKHVCEKEV